MNDVNKKRESAPSPQRGEEYWRGYRDAFIEVAELALEGARQGEWMTKRGAEDAK